jgi:hypothetical protein
MLWSFLGAAVTGGGRDKPGHGALKKRQALQGDWNLRGIFAALDQAVIIGLPVCFAGGPDR